jgi:hypothetical protein
MHQPATRASRSILTCTQVIPPWVTSSENVVELSDDGGWEHTETSEVDYASNTCFPYWLFSADLC